ncbi:Gx transporter family protein [Bulleidia sp. zg-1006]|uniref:Gx transporter family protein n=1 Tax=Bulleidia sp. zg-1006 TaxID=2806552 RepID=UPI001EEE7EC0|nr:Gx transporter family protein [Bulleidia sp. zg-1006]
MDRKLCEFMNRPNQTRHFTVLALLVAMAITVNLLETAMIPPIAGVFRIGLANIIALVAMKILGIKEMLIVNTMRVFIGTLMSGTFLGSNFWISFGGVLSSSIILIVCDYMQSSLLFTSVLSAIAHSVGQVMIVMFFYDQRLILVILPYFLLLSIPTGLLTGYISKLAIQRVKPMRA